MTIVNTSGYLTRRGKKREWYLIKADRLKCCVDLGRVIFPKHLIGQKVRFKVELIKDNGGEKDK